MEERIISYENNNEINQIISKMSNDEFFLTEHKTTLKKLYFKKFNNHPSKKITEDE
jgi:hypothetical protein